MVSSPTALTAFFLCSAVLPLFMLPRALRNRQKPGVSGLVVIILSASVWSFTTVVLRNTAIPMVWWLTANIRMLAVSGVVVGLALLTIEYTGRIELSRRVVGVLCLYPLFLQAAVWTNPLHHLFYRPFSALALGQLVEDNAGVLFFVHATVAFGLIFGSLSLLLAEVFRTGGTRRKQSIVLLLTPLPPTAVNILLTMGLLNGVDPTPPAFVVSVFMMTWALVTTDFLDIVPVGRYRAVESMDDPAVTLDMDEQVVDCNPAARDLVGVDSGWEGMSAAEFFAPIPAVAERVASTIDESEITVQSDDRRRHFDLTCSPIRDAQDETVGRLLVLRDITLLKERERELREREHELKRKNETLDEFASVVSHDVATPLGVIENKARLIEMTGETDHATEIYEASARVQELVDELRSLAREGNNVGELAPVELRAVAREAWASVESPDASLSLESSTAIEADRARLRQLLENLLENAVEHGGTDDLAVTVGVVKEGFYVEDDGVGLPEHMQDTLFEQGGTTGEDDTGLGLAIVKRIAEGHGWTVTAIDADSGGARFEVHTAE
jgi:PAS domain S-box-containing protein